MLIFLSFKRFAVRIKTTEFVAQTQYDIIMIKSPKLANSSNTADAGEMKITSKLSKNVTKYAGEFFKEIAYYFCYKTLPNVVI